MPYQLSSTPQYKQPSCGGAAMETDQERDWPYSRMEKEAYQHQYWNCNGYEGSNRGGHLARRHQGRKIISRELG
ncbi:predicted protein [Lichtheimia corymbifera JMRC:FSU:9682]|uniref:Uncharacterized protein n=1 Tax=Lichtheimia corymbifera JMRC:FSU:9682 TaxID=1263082 RepID=A0A068S9Q6_9FUNG|nr:predicted protein [Lichtheimia corymbifera JMRC:FSU:9682]